MAGPATSGVGLIRVLPSSFMLSTRGTGLLDECADLGMATLVEDRVDKPDVRREPLVFDLCRIERVDVVGDQYVSIGMRGSPEGGTSVEDRCLSECPSVAALLPVVLALS